MKWEANIVLNLFAKLHTPLRRAQVKMMWEVYKSPSSLGRGVVGVLEVDFVQPSHDKQARARSTIR